MIEWLAMIAAAAAAKEPARTLWPTIRRIAGKSLGANRSAWIDGAALNGTRLDRTIDRLSARSRIAIEAHEQMRVTREAIWILDCVCCKCCGPI